jgi:hypothetical protein
MVNGEWKDERARNDKWFTCLQDKSTTLKLIPMLQPKQLSYSPPTFYWNLNTIQANQITLFLAFFFLSFFLLLFFFTKELYSFSLFFSTFFFWTITTKIIIHPHTCLLATTIHFRKQRTQEVTIIVLQTYRNKGEMVWVNKENG